MGKAKSKRKGLTREEILKAPVSGIREVDTTEWGGCVYVRLIKASDYGRIRDFAKNIRLEGKKLTSDEETSMMLSWAIMVLCDEDGNALFKQTDTNKILELELAPLRRTIEAAMILNGFTDEDEETAVKN